MFRRFLIFLIGLAVVWSCYWLLTRNCLTVINETGQTVGSLNVTVGGETIGFGDLAMGASSSAHFRIGHEECFEVQCRRADGTEIHEYVGYVVWEDDLFGVSAKLAIRSNSVVDFALE
jgi:hypothetical protein